MCGIAGILGNIDPVRAEAAVRQMVGALARRGPDGEGIESWDQAVLGHRRLAIFDLSEAGRQPMLSRDRSVGVVFNGAIYNFRDLSGELTARGCVFASHTDTEVLIHGYREWGLDKLISKLRGMFAFGLWDDARKRLYLVRDRLGVKPLMFATGDRSIAFASTAGALRASGFVGEIDNDAVLDFIRLGFVTDERVIYRGAVKVQAGSVVEWDGREIKSRRYWTPPSAAESSRGLSFKQAVAETERVFIDSVAVRLHADVPVGVLLSGGIDSGLICWAVKKLGRDITAYTVAVPGDSWDEAGAARETARMLGIHHRVLEMSEYESPQIDELISAYSEPFACASALGMLKVSQAVAASAKVLLTGDGGDDAFLGYPTHRNLWLATKFSRVLPDPFKIVWLRRRAGFPRTGPLRRAAAFMDYASGDLDAFFSDGHQSLPRADGLLGERLSDDLPHDGAAPDGNGTGHPVERVLMHERRTRFVGEYMTKVDGATMHYGLEARSPFLDHNLWEFASSLPFDLRLRAGRPKAILRELARRNIGAGPAKREKTGFGVPVQRWLVGRWRPHVEAAFRDSILDRNGWVHAKNVRVQFDRAAGAGWAPEILWHLYVLEMWMKDHLVSRSVGNRTRENKVGQFQSCGIAH